VRGGNPRRRVVIAVILLLTASQGVFAIRRSRDRDVQRREALAAVADARDAMREKALAREERRDAEQAARRQRRDEWLNGRGITLSGGAFTAGVVVLGGLFVGVTFLRGVRRRRERAVDQPDAIGASPPDWMHGAEARPVSAAPAAVDR
jgi:hypothetical protein